MSSELPIPQPPRELHEIEVEDASLTFPAFTAHTAWHLGSLLRSKLVASEKPVVINISLAQGNHCLFHCTTHPGTTPDNDNWVARKRNTVLRWGSSTWYMHIKFAGDETAFAAKYGLTTNAGDYAIHGGGFPVRIVLFNHRSLFQAQPTLTLHLTDTRSWCGRCGGSSRCLRTEARARPWYHYPDCWRNARRIER